MTRRREYNYTYEEGRIIRAAESEIASIDGETILQKTLINTIRYYYDNEGKLLKKVLTPEKLPELPQAACQEQTIFYDAGEDNTVAKFDVKGRIVTAHSKTDSFGRKVFDEIQLGTGYVSRQFYYHTGNVSPLHTVYEKVKSAPTTHLVSQITLSDGTTLLYAYDNEERITQVTEMALRNGNLQTTTTHYSYDSLGQLTEEIVNNIPVNTVTYDNYGNIQTKNGKQYSYHGTWRDLLICYDGQEITYDHQGNPLSYLGHTLTWEKGRQLKSYDGHTYTYNANGIRTGKTVNGVTHNYVLDGTKILRESWKDSEGDKVLIPLYDNEDSVLGILYNNVPYYFLKNLQGDVIAILNQNAQVVVRYSYDAWGMPTILQDSSDCFLAIINPYLYRGYYFDFETLKYYLQSRYYDPVTGRFINADSIEWLGTNGTPIETNLFSYCKNNCVNKIDEVGYGGIDALLSALGSCIDILTKIITLIGNSHNKELKNLENILKIKHLTKKQSQSLINIKALQSETKKINRRLGWIGFGITFLTIAGGFATSCMLGRNIDQSIIELSIESFIALVEFGAGEFFEWIATLVPYVGFLLSLVAGWLVSYLFGKYFNDQRVQRIKAKFSAYVRDARVSLVNWIKNAVRSLTA